MVTAPSGPNRTGAFAAAPALAALSVIVGGCGLAAPDHLPKSQPKPAELPSVSGSLPDVTVTLAPKVQVSAEARGHAWYVTAIKDPVRGGYTAAMERRSLNALRFDSTHIGDQRASITVVLHNGRPTDLLLSVDREHFACQSDDRNNACALDVSVDGSALRQVWFAVPRHWSATHLHLAGGGDATQLLAAITKAHQLSIQATFHDEGSPELEFALSGLSQAIDKLTKRTVAATPKLAAASPGV